ncbi:MAG: L-histidine N(alpha)-methyltransferase [Gemmatimonadetes bacterium]|nr:L-histidine N(alpha)-methyltransferase [Gemmatimonadota bacterium]
MTYFNQKQSDTRDWRWSIKSEIIKDLLGAFNMRDAVEAVFPSAQDRSRVDEITTASYKWSTHYPTKYRYFFDKLATTLGCEPTVHGLTLVRASVDEFIELLPENRREQARKVVRKLTGHVSEPTPQSTSRESRAVPDAESTRQGARFVRLNHTKDFESLTSGVKAGLLDTRNYYSTADAADVWQNLVSAESYRMYDQCKAGLRALLQDAHWLDALRETPLTTAVMLAGGGAPTKDLVILRSLLDQPAVQGKTVSLVLVDINFYMLYQSRRLLDRARAESPWSDRVNFEYVIDDVLALGDSGEVFHREGPTLFAITGGTIGNLSEMKFFRSLNRIAEPRDLLIVSADTVDGLPPNEVKEELERKYNHEEMRRFITPGVRAVIDELGLPLSVQDALRTVEVRVRPDAESGLSDVPGSWSVALVQPAAHREVTLLSSTRYVSDELEAFIARLGWELICAVPSPANAHYVQFCFRRRSAESA